MEDSTSKACRSFSTLCRLCGDNDLARVLLGTTHWGNIGETKGMMHEQRLAKTFWKYFEPGLKSLRFNKTETSARAFLDSILAQLPVTMIMYFFLPLFTVIWTDSLY